MAFTHRLAPSRPLQCHAAARCRALAFAVRPTTHGRLLRSHVASVSFALWIGPSRLSWTSQLNCSVGHSHGSTAPPTALRRPLPPLQPLPLLPQVALALPPTLVLHTPTTLLYTLSNPTPRLLRLSAQIDSAPEPGTFVFAGPRKLPTLLLAPYEQREVGIKVVPLAMGRCRLPRLRVFLHEAGVAGAGELQGEQQGTVVPEDKVTEVFVVAQEVVRMPEGEGEGREQRGVLEEELRSARLSSEDAGRLGSDFSVMVLPR